MISGQHWVCIRTPFWGGSQRSRKNCHWARTQLILSHQCCLRLKNCFSCVICMLYKRDNTFVNTYLPVLISSILTVFTSVRPKLLTTLPWRTGVSSAGHKKSGCWKQKRTCLVTFRYQNSPSCPSPGLSSGFTGWDRLINVAEHTRTFRMRW